MTARMRQMQKTDLVGFVAHLEKVCTHRLKLVQLVSTMCSCKSSSRRLNFGRHRVARFLSSNAPVAGTLRQSKTGLEGVAWEIVFLGLSHRDATCRKMAVACVERLAGFKGPEIKMTTKKGNRERGPDENSAEWQSIEGRCKDK